MRLMTYNIRLGIETRLADVAEAIRVAGTPDLLALQEIGVRWRMGERVDQPAALAEALGLPYHAFAGALTDDQGGQFGIALLSRAPLSQIQIERLPLEADEQRVLLSAYVEAPTPFYAFNTHLSIKAPERLRQAQRLAARLREAAGPLILLGDLNDAPDSAPLRALKAVEGLADGFDVAGEGGALTFSVAAPAQRLDYALSRGPRCRRAYVEYAARASDHFPLVAEMEMEAPPCA
ncbi:endonuclease/exonuclease/phosphatase family protein [Myxococcota bacterium]|nr:endonuclease/exonuclease/phosphatase family protein [Myxococcota bacterium]MBU1429946.1 endonuclease/exonuclease/phosphatase family protein [Myxococcota bacterium]MBU1899049.1 endonuclease/exonuclease/phosphatase family protein [Myxococcota bacterium]